jgi:uncharacterized protein YqjF (DUF2071 family)
VARADVRGRVIVGGVLAVQALFLVRGIWADHPVFAWRMFPEASDWRADIVRVSPDGTRVPIDDGAWSMSVRGRGLSNPSVRHHADAGVDNQLAFLRSALRWYADHDGKAGVIEADVTYWRNVRGPRRVVYRSDGT